MKIKTLLALFLSLFIFVQGSMGQENRSRPLPGAVFPEPVCEFPTIVDGLKVRHDFIVQNRGNAELKIQKVRTG